MSVSTMSISILKCSLGVTFVTIMNVSMLKCSLIIPSRCNVFLQHEYVYVEMFSNNFTSV